MNLISHEILSTDLHSTHRFRRFRLRKRHHSSLLDASTIPAADESRLRLATQSANRAETVKIEFLVEIENHFFRLQTTSFLLRSFFSFAD